MTRFLVTNDDGVESPMLPLMVKELQSLGEVRMVVPATEQSWKGKSITRFERLIPQKLEGFGIEAYTINGTPSDCVNLAVHNLFSDKPDWIISGINMGRNTGMSYVINSGTLGAALEGAILGIPSLAFSLKMPPSAFMQWTREKRVTGEPESRDLEESAKAMTRVVRGVMASGLPDGAMTLNINFPIGIRPETPIRWTRLADNRYGALFRPDGEGFLHGLKGETIREEGEGLDWSTVDGGETSITPITLRGFTANGVEPIPIP